MKVKRSIFLVLLTVTVLAASVQALARHRFGARVGFGFGRTPYPASWYVARPYRFHSFGLGYHPHLIGNFGRVDFNVKPKQSAVYVDSVYIGTADDFNGGFFGKTARLKPGIHRIRVVAPDGRTEERRIYVQSGRELDFNLQF